MIAKTKPKPQQDKQNTSSIYTQRGRTLQAGLREHLAAVQEKRLTGTECSPPEPQPLSCISSVLCIKSFLKTAVEIKGTDGLVRLLANRKHLP